MRAIYRFISLKGRTGTCAWSKVWLDGSEYPAVTRLFWSKKRTTEQRQRYDMGMGMGIGMGMGMCMEGMGMGMGHGGHGHGHRIMRRMYTNGS